MQIIQNYKINIIYLILAITLLTIYILPVYEISLTINKFDKLFFGLFSLLFFLIHQYAITRLKIRDLFLLTFIFYRVIFCGYVEDLNLIGLIVIDRIIDNGEYVKQYFKKNNLLGLCIVGVIIFSLIYFGLEGRYIYTPIREKNQSAFAFFYLCLVIKYRNKKVGNFMLLFGLFSLSKSYLLSLIILYLFRGNLLSKWSMKIRLDSFIRWAMVSSIILIVISHVYGYIYHNYGLTDYGTGLNRFVVILDISNFNRFRVNTNLLEMYQQSPNMLLTGISDDKFSTLNLVLSREKGEIMRNIHPHNFFYSYFQIYGIMSIFIFYYIHKMFKKIVNRENLPIFIATMTYLIFLGIGGSSYWLGIVVITLLLNDQKSINIKNNM